MILVHLRSTPYRFIAKPQLEHFEEEYELTQSPVSFQGYIASTVVDNPAQGLARCYMGNIVAIFLLFLAQRAFSVADFTLCNAWKVVGSSCS